MADEDKRPLLDRIGAKNVNIGLAVIYILMVAWGVTALVMVPANVNIEWPIVHAFAYTLGIALVHFGLIAAGTTLVPNYTYYPVRPQWLFMITDGVMFFAIVGVVASFILNATSSAVPLFGTWFLIIGLCVNLWKLWELTFGSQQPKSDSVLGA